MTTRPNCFRDHCRYSVTQHRAFWLLGVFGHHFNQKRRTIDCLCIDLLSIFILCLLTFFFCLVWNRKLMIWILCINYKWNCCDILQSCDTMILDICNVFPRITLQIHFTRVQPMRCCSVNFRPRIFVFIGFYWDLLTCSRAHCTG